MLSEMCSALCWRVREVGLQPQDKGKDASMSEGKALAISSLVGEDLMIEGVCLEE